LKAHIDVDHVTVTKRFKEEVNNLMQGKKNTINNKKRIECVWGIYPKTIIVKDSFKNDEV
jgi:hypothetical protein